MEAQETVNKIADYLLGKDWYIVDSVYNSQANAIIYDEIVKRFKPVDKSDLYKYREHHKKCEYCQYNKWVSGLHTTDPFQKCKLSDDITHNYKAKFCRYYKVEDEKL